MTHEPNGIDLHTSSMRLARRGHLSLGLIDTRNRLLAAFTQIHDATGSINYKDGSIVAQLKGLSPAQWLLGYAGWFQEWWIGRNTQRALGESASAQPLRLASIDPHADPCFDPQQLPWQERWSSVWDPVEHTKAYLMETLETTLELLEKTQDNDAQLYFFKLALFHEDMLYEQLAMTAQALGLAIDLPLPVLRSTREVVHLPAMHYQLGHVPHEGAGFAWDNEAGAHHVQVPAYDIDAQPVNWAQYAEFVDDGGYDEVSHWSAQGRQWLQHAAQDGRRSPRYVEHMGASSGAVVQTRFGQTCRVPGSQCAMHLSWYEADAYARWAGRRLPTEVEWEIAASKARGMGFVWGNVWEWTAGTFRPYPGFVPSPWQAYSARGFGRCKVLRGASFATPPRLHTPAFRGFALAHSDSGFYGFRTCSL